MKSFRIHDGFHLEAVAVEPMVTDPVSVCYDAHGRLYVVEMRGYPFPEKNPSGQVTRLEDRDGDGRFETRTVFLDGLSWPTGIVPYAGGVFIAVAPEIIYAKDTNGDGVADVRNVMFTGFGTDNVQGLLNGLLWGPDGWIYGVASVNGGTIQNRSRPEKAAVSVRGRDFRFKPDGSAFEAISGGGQFGHSLRRLGTSLHLQQQQPYPADRSAFALPRAQPGPDSTGGDPRHRRGRAGLAGVPDQPAGALASRANSPASRRSRDVAATAAEPSCLRPAFSRPRPESPSTAARLIRRNIAEMRSSGTSGATWSIGRSSKSTGRRTGRVGPISRPSSWLRPTTGFVRSTSPTRPRERCSSSTCIARRSSTRSRYRSRSRSTST